MLLVNNIYQCTNEWQTFTKNEGNSGKTCVHYLEARTTAWTTSRCLLSSKAKPIQTGRNSPLNYVVKPCTHGNTGIYWSELASVKPFLSEHFLTPVWPFRVSSHRKYELKKIWKYGVLQATVDKTQAVLWIAVFIILFKDWPCTINTHAKYQLWMSSAVWG